MRILFLFLLSSTLFASEALDRLIEGNNRFITGNLEHPNRSEERRKEVAYSQEPFAVILACADSRVAPEIIFDQGIGDLFVARVAGNVVGPLINESIDFAAIALKSDIIVILGHERCGAVQAVLDHKTDLIPEIAARVEPAARKYPDNLEMAIKQNALNMRAFLMKTPALAEKIKSGHLEIVAGYYNLKSGKVDFLKS